jgi:hypothetical protein
VIEHINSRGDWAAPAGYNHGFDSGTWASEDCLDGAIAAIAHPTMQPAPVRLVLDKGAITDALNLTAHNNVANDVAAHPNSPASKMRAPVQRETDQRSTERI